MLNNSGKKSVRKCFAFYPTDSERGMEMVLQWTQEQHASLRGLDGKARYRFAILAEIRSMPDKLDLALRAVESS